jgi:hypothetical protein
MPRALGWSVFALSCLFTLMTRHPSADIVARMIVSKITGQEWELPPWFPLHYLTSLDHSQQVLRNHDDVPC